MKSKILMATVVASLLMLGIAGVAQANSMLMKMEKNANEWVMPTGNYFNHRYSALDQINSGNVGNLKVAWQFSTGGLRGHEGGPLIIGDTMYIHSSIYPEINVYALNLDDQSIIWHWQSHMPDQKQVLPVMCCDQVNRGVAYGDGMIFVYQADAQLVALDAKTGKMMWKANNRDVRDDDKHLGATGTSAPMVYNDKVYVGISGGEFGVQGHLTAYDMKTGKRVWRGYSTGPDSLTLMHPTNTTHLGKAVGKDSGTSTWEGDQWKIGGGTTWGWYSFDPELNLVYYGTGNPSTWNPVQRPGDNRWSMTIFARDADTGMAKWVYQMTPHDEWDYDGINEMILADIEVNGRMRKTLVHFDRNGFGYTLDRVTGELLVAEKYDPAVNWASHVDMKTGRPMVLDKYSTHHQGADVNTTGICPAALGTKDQQPAAFSPKTSLFYVPTNHVCMDYEPFEVSYTEGQPYVGATLKMFPAPGGDHMGNFIAWDAAKGKIVWSNPERFSVWSGALATAGDVVFYGTLEGYAKAVRADNGKELFKFKTPSGIIGNFTTYMHDGKQYVAILSGVGGWAGIGMAAGLTNDTDGLGAVGGYRHLENYTRLGGVLTVFSL